MSVGTGRTPPGPRGRRLVGNLQDYEADRLAFLEKVHHEYGAVVRFDDNATIVNDVAYAREILRGAEGKFQISEDFLQRRLGRSDIETVLRVRPHLDPGLRPAATAPFQPTIANFAENALASLPHHPVDPLEVLEEVTSRAITSYYFGTDGEAVRFLVGRLLEVLSEVIGNPFALPAYVWSPRRQRIRRRHAQARDAVVRLLTDRRRQPDSFDDASSVLLRGAERRNPHPLPRLADLIIGAMLASYRVPAASLAWLLMLVADNPTIHDRLADTVSQQGRHCPKDKEHVTLSQACVMEALRLYPATWLLSRTADQSTCLGPWQFAPRHTFLISPWIMHRDPANFTAPDDFRPDRWMTGSRVVTPAYIPFGHGQHACPGNHFAVALMTTTLETIVRRHRIVRTPSVVTPDARTTLIPAGLRLQLVPLTLSSQDRVPYFAGTR